MQVNRALIRVDSAAELDQHPVADQLEDAAVMAGDERLQDLRATCLQSLQRPHLVLLHEATEADHIGGEYRGKVALSALLGHGRFSLGQ